MVWFSRTRAEDVVLSASAVRHLSQRNPCFSFHAHIDKQTSLPTLRQEDFEGVIANCSRLRYDERGAWLGEEMVAAYTELHRQGFAASVEVWDAENGEERLVGGLYGVCLGPAFFGESMFSLVPSASKLALIHLARIMEQNGGTLIDCQLKTPHLESMGGRFISYDE